MGIVRLQDAPISLREGLSNYCATQRTHRSCGGCKGTGTSCDRETRLWSVPEMLVLLPQRDIASEDVLEYPVANLDLAEFVVDAATGSVLVYDLIAVW